MTIGFKPYAASVSVLSPIRLLPVPVRFRTPIHAMAWVIGVFIIEVSLFLFLSLRVRVLVLPLRFVFLSVPVPVCLPLSNFFSFQYCPFFFARL